MKYIILAVLLTCCVLVNNAQAVEPKVSYFYEVSDSQFIKLIGTSVQEDVADIKGLDIDFWYQWGRPDTEITYDSIENVNNLIMPGVSYSKEIKGWDIGINAGLGQDRIENIKDLGEAKYGIGICIGKKI